MSTMAIGNVLLGRSFAHSLCQRIKTEVAYLISEFNVQPKLTVIEVGHRSDSALYIEHKQHFAHQCGIELSHIRLPSSCSEASLLDTIRTFNSDSSVHGIMLQLPIDCEQNISASRSLYEIVADKDVEGLGFVNTTLLSRENGICPSCDGLKYNQLNQQKMHIPCTAAACLVFIRHVNFPLRGSHCVVVGRGRLVGAPMADLLAGPGQATVTQCHIYSRNLADEVARADLVVAGTGCPELVKGAWIKPGALVLDCGYAVTTDPSNPSKMRSVGDVQFDEARKRAGWITGVPGGIGPLNIAMLFRNTLNSARWSLGLNSVLCDCICSATHATVCSDAAAQTVVY